MTETTPKLRFPEFTAPWRPARGGDAFHNSRARGEDGLPIYSVTLDRGLVPRSSLERHLSADAADEQNLRAQPDDLVYNTMRMWQGAVGRADVECMVSPAYVVLSPKKGVSSAFFNEWFKHPRMRHLLGAYSHGLTSDRLRLYADDFAQIPMALPEPSEQERIAAALGHVDHKIALLRERRDALAQFKSGTMDRILRQEIRFKKDDGSEFPTWTAKPLGSVATINPKNEKLPTKFEYIELGGVERGVLVSTVTTISESAPDRAQRLLRRGDILFQAVRPNLMNNLLFQEVGTFVASTGFAQIRATGDPTFLYHILHSRSFQREVMRRCTGTGYPAINSADLSAILIALPSEDESKKIATALSLLDAKIFGVAAEIANLEELRNGLVQRFFP